MMTRSKSPYLWAVLGAVSWALGQGHSSISLAAIATPVLLLSYGRRVRWHTCVFGVGLLGALVHEWAYRGTVPFPAAARLGLFFGISLVVGLLIAVHAHGVQKENKPLGVFILPCGWAAFEFLTATFSPNGTWGSLAYSFVGFISFLQLASIGGWMSLTFVAVLLSSLMDFAIHSTGRQRAQAVAGMVLLVMATLGFGAYRVSKDNSSKETLRIAGIHGPTIHEVEGSDLIYRFHQGFELSSEERKRANTLAQDHRRRLFEETASAAAAGADLVAWSEVLVWTTFENELSLEEEAAQWAKKLSVDLVLGIGVYDPSRKRAYENKLTMITREGRVAWRYLKSRPTPGARHVRGNGRLPVNDLEDIRMSAAICFDLDFPNLFSQSGQRNVELLVAPSFDDDRVRFMHARMARFRAVEQGFTLVRVTAYGLNEWVDPFGRVQAVHDAYGAEMARFIFEVEVNRLPTMYPALGDVLGWSYLGLFCSLSLVSCRSGRRGRAENLR